MNILNWHEIGKNFSIPTLGRTRFGALILGIGILLALAWLGINTQTVVVGQRVRELEGKLDRVNHENAQLEYDIAVLSQPKRIADRAAALGLRPATLVQTTYLAVNYTPRVVTSQGQQPSAKAGRSFDWVASWNEVLGWLGLGADSRAAEASP